MCTTGVTRLAGGYALFKNKDFGRKHLDDRIHLDVEVFGVLGMTTWAGDDPDKDAYSGLSIGANRHGLLCCDSNVATLDGLVNYDVMTEIALRDGTDVASAVEAVRAACASAPTSWGNLVLIDQHDAACIEIRGSEVAVLPLDAPTARSNHHVVLGHHELEEDRVTTDLRLAAAQRRLKTAATLDDIFALQSAHDDGGTTGVCNHTAWTTVYSYVLSVDGDGIQLHVLQGSPCSGAGRVQLNVPLGDRYGPDAAADFIRSYPTATKRNYPLSIGGEALTVQS